jgi:GntR family transcriptional regulator, transcriptional repressor for pyruvate dehydrogenase complex
MVTDTKKPKELPHPFSVVAGREVGKTRNALTRQVADVMAERIVSGEFPEESLLPSERQLCEGLQVSRTVIREAIKALESRGLVRVEQGRGMIVQEPQLGPLTDALRLLIRRREHLVDDLLELRKILEVHMVVRAAERRTEANIKNMERFLEEMRKNPNKSQGYASADLEFHMEIARATQNPVLLVLLEPLSDLSIKSREDSYLGPKVVKLRAQQHEEILTCIRHRDGKGAQAAMSKHLVDTECDLRSRAASRRSNSSARA